MPAPSRETLTSPGPRPLVTALTVIGCATIAAVHLWLLYRSGLDPVSTPVSRLSLLERGGWHGVGLVAFALAHVALAFSLHRRDGGRLRLAAVVLIGIAALLVLLLAVYFARATLTSTAAAWPLWMLASIIGVAMGLLLPGLRRQSRTAFRFNLGCLVAWLALVPLYLLVDERWIGGYERLVGLVYTIWIVGLAVLLGRRSAKE